MRRKQTLYPGSHTLAGYPIREGDYTFEEFVDLVEDGQKADLLDGVIYIASPENTDEAGLLTWLVAVIFGFADAKAVGKVYVSQVAYRIGLKQGPVPDLGFVPKELEKNRRRGYIDGPPMFVIEIVSPDSVGRDYIHKRAINEQAGIREYWILDPDEQRATFLVLSKGRYRERKPTRNVIESQVIPGLKLDVRWLTGQARPRPSQVLQRLLKA